MTALALAVRQGDWERVALYLLLGVAKVAERLPPESLAALLDLLSGEDVPGEADAR